MHCWILINIDLEYKDMNYFLRKPIFSCASRIVWSKTLEIWKYCSIWILIKIFLFQKIWYSKTKRIDYLLRQCDDLWVAFHQSESIYWAVGEKIALGFFFISWYILCVSHPSRKWTSSCRFKSKRRILKSM